MIKNDIDLTKIYDIGDKIADVYRRQLGKDKRVASGNLIRFRDDFQYTDDNMYLNFILPYYWKYVEYGRGKTMKDEGGVVVEKIMEWIRLKNIIPHPNKDGKIPSTKQLAYAIATDIHKGSLKDKGSHSLEKAMNSPEVDALIKQLCDEIGKAMYRNIEYSLIELTDLK